MVQRDQVPEGVTDIDYYRTLIEALERADAVSVDDNDGSLTIDTDDGPIEVNSDLKVEDVRDPAGDTVFGEAASIAPDTTGSAISYSPSSEQAITGFTGNGDSNGLFRLQINGTTKASQWTNQSSPNADIYFDNPIVIDSTDTVVIEIENIGLSSASYEATLMIRL